MKRLFTAVLVLTMVFAVPGLAQWNFVDVFPDSNFTGSSGNQGLCVDKDGKVWIQFYGNTGEIWDGTDTVATREINCFNADGTEASFSPFNVITVGSDIDTLYNSNRGLRTMPNGDILISSFDILYKVDPATGAGMAKMMPIDGQTLDAAACTDDNEVVCGFVLPGNPMKIYDSDFAFLGNAVDTLNDFSRSFEISGDGNDIYWGGFTAPYIVKISSAFGTLGPYDVFDTVSTLMGLHSESFDWHPVTGNLWLSSGYQTLFDSAWTPETWYEYDPVADAILDSIVWDRSTYFYGTGDTGPRPRAIDFSPGGDTAYVACFNTNQYSVQMFVKGPTSVKPLEGAVPDDYQLSQNYPNPFNPTTEIQFSVPKAGMTTLIVYDMLGAEVERLVAEDLSAGTYRTSFDATRLSSGTYVYVLTSGGVRISKKMMLIK
jgi:hypothetical protein